MGSQSLTIKNAQDQEFKIVHNDNAGALSINTTDLVPLATTVNSKITAPVSTDNAVVRFDGTTGQVQNSGVVIDDNNNVGIGVTPSAWSNSYGQKALQIGPSAALSSLYVDNTNIQTTLSSNAGDPFNVKYLANGAASKYLMYNGTHQWFTAPSGTAGNAITWTNTMTLNNTGNLLIGTTTDNGVDKLQVNGSIQSKARSFGVSNLNDLYLVSETVIVDNSTLNIPINDYGYVTVVTNGSNYAMQTFVGLNAPARLFLRVKAGSGGWSAWSEK